MSCSWPLSLHCCAKRRRDSIRLQSLLILATCFEESSASQNFTRDPCRQSTDQKLSAHNSASGGELASSQAVIDGIQRGLADWTIALEQGNIDCLCLKIAPAGLSFQLRWLAAADSRQRSARPNLPNGMQVGSSMHGKCEIAAADRTWLTRNAFSTLQQLCICPYQRHENVLSRRDRHASDGISQERLLQVSVVQTLLSDSF
ncbi:uncharacterized protein L969DRAFT_90250 [Mixia osmundae IAM 14324]|uniref:uncharacterized protein n=1 Tax=Mixia osmundae (strain CBS 9802 / IAM 14324 / JCM 22182 / KY 12970) TaxID=764103 RepID=UPI0004A54B48|nr:uncharacterized protein L969DRAFT_90250 [Mixia osmundae IAM 14324]KEI37178.1 hypothetical protein L969DRAFT_90250 [Mixia osmundae IAM 14324]